MEWPSLLLVIATLSVGLLSRGALCDDTIDLDYTVEEETGVGVFIGDTWKDSRLLYNQSLLFQTFTKGNENVKYLAVNEANGIISTAKNIDREVICKREKECKINVEIAVYRKMVDPQTASFTSTMIVMLQVVIDVTDINDNSPKFPSRVVNLDVPENKPVGHTEETSVASDDDSEGPNSRLTYRFESPSDVFELSTAKANDGLEDLVITVKKVLDREVKQLYPLTVVATDLGSPQRNGTVLINVRVTDVNDQVPVFGQLNYTVNILENSDTSAPVVIVTASDGDEGENARLTYSLSTQVNQEIRDTFTVEPDTGKIFARKPLDYEARAAYQFYVSVSDNGSPPKSNFAYVTVNVIDVNDNAPEIQINLAPGRDMIQENAITVKSIGLVRAKDSDSGIYGKVTCTIGDTHFALDVVDVNQGVYQINLIRELDREEAPRLNVVVTCQDGDKRPLSASASFSITVLDVNDNDPIFLSSTLYGSVKENGGRQTSVMRVVAEDLDDDKNGRLTYSLTSGDDLTLFSINQDTGVISTTQTLDREVKQEYRLVVKATDNGDPKRSSAAQVIIKVLDENDNPPKFSKQAFFNSIVENLPPGSPAGDVPAYDTDSQENGRFVYSIFDVDLGDVDGKFFIIDPDTGLLKSNVSFDRELKSTYRFRVKVADPTVSNYFDIANVTVTIVDDNDHAPMVIQPPPNARTYHCMFNLTVGTVVTTFISSDEDDPSNVEISYELQEPVSRLKNSAPLFSIDALTGNMRLARQIRPEDVDTHKLEVVVRDGRQAAAQSSTVTVTVVVEAGSEEAMRAFDVDSGKTTNMIIVIIIVAVTIIIAIVIIAIICLIRRVDKKRGSHPPKQNGADTESKLYQAAKWVSSVSVPNDLCPEEARATLEVPCEKKKKKEVSFSLDDEVVGSQDADGSMGSAYSPSPKTMQRVDVIPFSLNAKQQGDFIVIDGMTQPDYSQHLYAVKNNTTADVPPDEHQFMEVSRQAEDRYSDASSGDTGTSDSGRGGSEDESHGHGNTSLEGDGRKLKFINSGPTSNKHDSAFSRYQQQQLGSDNEEIPGSPTPMLSESEKQSSNHCYIRRSFDQLPAHGIGYPAGASTSSARSSPSPSINTVTTSPYINGQSRHSSARLALSHTDVEGPFRVKKAEQQQQLLQTFSSPFAAGVPSTNTHPAWRRAKGLDTSWRSNASSHREDDDNTTTSGSYTINHDDVREDGYNPDIMV
ncbi:unnamed protein product [Lymnaea stagnalis]|uniref:Cadherin domain-containing protein n=1 Tax=Lymnaea stagnalis TaxID=6523 RepID=A0AAV2IM97_LYMST